MSIVKKINKTFFVSKSSVISEERRRQYYIVLIFLLCLHIVGLTIVMALVKSSGGINTYLTTVSTYLNFIVFFSGLIIVILSLKNEVVGSQAFEIASSISSVNSHVFESFDSHLEWIIQNVSPTNFKNNSVNLTISVSTPIYGIGMNSETASIFLDYIESWVLKYEEIKNIPITVPNITFSVWNKEDNLSTFTNNYEPEENLKKLALCKRFGKQIDRLKILRKKGYINFNLFFTDKCDTRIFIANEINSPRISGLFAVFTPLTPSAVKNKGWTLTGFSFREEKVYNDIIRFSHRLSHQDHVNERIDQLHSFENAEKWLLDHYGLKEEQQNANKRYRKLPGQ